jgi:uncharacterized phage protein (TIGR02220 family)
MDKLQWFKFSPGDWMMGKIMRCQEVTQAKFIRLCCLYWNKECELSYEDAELEIDKDPLEELIKRKVVISDGDFISISFLDEQRSEIDDSTESKSRNGVIGNLKRWHPKIYKEYSAKKISLDEAIKLSKNVADQSLPDPNPIAKDRREEEIREEKKRVIIVEYLNKKTNKSYRHNTHKTKSVILARINEGFTVEDFKRVIDNKSKDWKDDQKMSKFLRPETLFGNKFEGYLNEKPVASNRSQYQTLEINPYTGEPYAK